MLPCPSCGERAIREHSVLVPLASLASAEDVSDELSVYSRCVRCDAVFLRPDSEVFTAVSSDVLGEKRSVWLIPPWKKRTDNTGFEMSWDVVEAFFENQSLDLDWVRPLNGLITELRAAGLDSHLRAGQSLNSLGLSRSREDGLRDGQSHLFLCPQPDGSLVIEGRVLGDVVEFGSVAASYEGVLRATIEKLSSVPID